MRRGERRDGANLKTFEFGSKKMQARKSFILEQSIKLLTCPIYVDIAVK